MREACFSRGAASGGDEDGLVPYEVLCSVHKAAFVVSSERKAPPSLPERPLIKTPIQAVSGADLGAASERTSD